MLFGIGFFSGQDNLFFHAASIDKKRTAIVPEILPASLLIRGLLHDLLNLTGMNGAGWTSALLGKWEVKASKGYGKAKIFDLLNRIKGVDIREIRGHTMYDFQWRILG